MNTTEKSYCRLCAENKPRNKMANFQNDTVLWQEIVKKLSRFNIFIDRHESILPKTVCFICSKSLHFAFNFVTTVEHAQATLSDYIVVQTQELKEESDSNDVDTINEKPDEIMNNSEEINDNPYIQCKDADKNVSIEDYNNSVLNKSNEPHDDENEFVCIKEIEVTGKKLETVECKTSIDTFREVKKDKTVNAPLSINIGVKNPKEVHKIKMLKSTPIVVELNKEYSTDFIDKEINRLANVPIHAITKTWMDFNWKCSYCETLFLNVDELQTHSMKYHNTCNAYQCVDCNARKLKLNGFIKHVRQHRKYLHYSCYQCFRKFSNRRDVTLHRWVHNSSKYICLGCNNTFPSKAELETHVGRFYKNIWDKIKKVEGHWQDDSFTCHLCEKYFKAKGNLFKHLQLSHTNRKREHFCEICGKGFYDKITLNNHMSVHSDAKPYQCEICKHKFKKLCWLRYHAKVHSGEKPFKCDKCGRCFRQKKNLSRHSDTHTELLSHSCTLCDKKFRTKDYLQNHMRRHTGERLYSCDVCDREFIDWSNYNKHMKRKHGMDKSKKKRTPLGPHAIDPTTGDVIYPEMDKVIEFNEKMKEPIKRIGRRRVVLRVKNTQDKAQ